MPQMAIVMLLTLESAFKNLELAFSGATTMLNLEGIQVMGSIGKGGAWWTIREHGTEGGTCVSMRTRMSGWRIIRSVARLGKMAVAGLVTLHVHRASMVSLIIVVPR